MTVLGEGECGTLFLVRNTRLEAGHKAGPSCESLVLSLNSLSCSPS